MVMVDISASMVKELRDKSGAAMMDCKKALVESSGDFEKAVEWLRKKGVATAGKKSARATSEGLVVGKVSECGKQATILEVNCETDFVARTDQFVDLCSSLAEAALESKCSTKEDLAKAKTKSGSVEELLTAGIAKTGENIQLARVNYHEVEGEGVIGLYIHKLGGKMGALVELSSDKPVDVQKGGELARELAMHIVSTKPAYLNKSDVPKEMVEEERRIESEKSDLEKKPPEIREKIITGRVDKILAEKCLSEQPFVKDPSVTVCKHIENTGKDLGVSLEAKKFTLFVLGDS